MAKISDSSWVCANKPGTFPGQTDHQCPELPIFIAPTLARPTQTSQPRAVGSATVSCKVRAGKTVLDRLHQKGSLKLLFPRSHGSAMTGVLLNTAGGITGGDCFDVTASVAAGCHLILTTQAAERAYRAQPDETGALTSRLSIARGGRIDWLPQETLLYEQSDLRRELRIDMAQDSTLLMVEPLVFGRAAMGETLHQIAFRDKIDLYRNDALVFADRTILKGDAVSTLTGTATGAGCGALANVLLAAPDAETHLDTVRAMMPANGGVSLIRDGVLFARILATDGFALRKTLLPLIEQLGAAPPPRTWMI